MDRRRRVLVLVALVVLSASTLGVRGVTAPSDSTITTTPEGGEGMYPGHTLVTVQSYVWFDHDNGAVLIVDRDGETVWRYAPPNAWVFDAELLENGNVLVSMGRSAQSPDVTCPAEYGGTPESGTPGKHRCIENRVVEVDFESKEVVWEYDWYDAFPTHHEVHDADRLENGETAIVDMGNDRAFTVNRAGEITWQWNATEHIAEGTAFWEEYVPEDAQREFRREGPESDWTHMNDVDRLENGNFQLSIRNFDVVLEVDPGTNEIVDVVGAPGDHDVMSEQHNPMRIEHAGTMLIADSENDRIIEIDVETEEIVWSYDGTGSGDRLAWPRDADRLPNGNTLVTDSRNSRVLEVGPNGTVVWQWSVTGRRAIVYEADRVRLPDDDTYLDEEPADVPAGREYDGRSGGGVDGLVGTVVSWLSFLVPPWAGPADLLVGLVGLTGLIGLGREGWHMRRE